jgi:hypothetical protein
MQDELFNCCLRCGLGSPLRCQIILESFSSQIQFRYPFACSFSSFSRAVVLLLCVVSCFCVVGGRGPRLVRLRLEHRGFRMRRKSGPGRAHCDGYRHNLNLQCSCGFITCLFSRRASRDTKVTSTVAHRRGEKRILLYRVYKVESLC